MVGGGMEQASFSELKHDMKKRRTRREVFLGKMDALVPWARLEARIEPFYPKAQFANCRRGLAIAAIRQVLGEGWSASLMRWNHLR